MNILEAFDELDSLEEAFAGDYKSPYLTISDAERHAAKQKYEHGKNYRCRATADGMSPLTRFELERGRSYDLDHTYFVLDYEAFHKAYDKELERAGLLSMFKADGTIGPRGCYGNIKEANLSKTDPAYIAAIELWKWEHDDVYRGKRYITISAEEEAKLIAYEKECKEYNDKLQAKKAAEEARIKAATDAANLARETLEDILPDALALVDQDLLDQLEEAGADGVDIGRLKTDNVINVDKFGSTPIPMKPVEEYTPEFLAELITDFLKSLDLETQVKRHYLGLDLVQQIHSAHSSVMAYWVHEGTSEIYVPASKFTQLVNKETKAVASSQDLSQCTLAFIKISKYGQRQTNSATEDIHHSHYYSYNNDLVEDTDLQVFAPEEKTDFLYDQSLKYHKDFDEVSGYHVFYNYPGFDTWVQEHETIYGNG